MLMGGQDLAGKFGSRRRALSTEMTVHCLHRVDHSRLWLRCFGKMGHAGWWVFFTWTLTILPIGSVQGIPILLAFNSLDVIDNPHRDPACSSKMDPALMIVTQHMALSGQIRQL